MGWNERDEVGQGWHGHVDKYFTSLPGLYLRSVVAFLARRGLRHNARLSDGVLTSPQYAYTVDIMRIWATTVHRRLKGNSRAGGQHALLKREHIRSVKLQESQSLSAGKGMCRRP